MTNVLKIKTDVKGLDVLDEHINIVENFLTSKDDFGFQKFLQDKCIEVIKQQTDILLNFAGDTVELYKSNNKVRSFAEGFIIYNDTTVETESEGYDGTFSIALAFEYGTGVAGQDNPKDNAWAYNVNQHEKGWVYFKNESFHFTSGYQGAEIYRTSAREIQSKLGEWTKEYFRKR